jgi:hypothetical protein
MSHTTITDSAAKLDRELPPAISPRPLSRVGAGPLAASLAFAWRSLLKIRHVPEQLGDVIGIPILFTLLFNRQVPTVAAARHARPRGRLCHRLQRREPQPRSGHRSV